MMGVTTVPQRPNMCINMVMSHKAMICFLRQGQNGLELAIHCKDDNLAFNSLLLGLSIKSHISRENITLTSIKKEVRPDRPCL